MRETAPPCERTSTPSCSKAARSRLTVAAVTPRAAQRSDAVIVRCPERISRIRNLRSSASMMLAFSWHPRGCPSSVRGRCGKPSARTHCIAIWMICIPESRSLEANNRTKTNKIVDKRSDCRYIRATGAVDRRFVESSIMRRRANLGDDSQILARSPSSGLRPPPERPADSSSQGSFVPASSRANHKFCMGREELR